MIKRKNYDGVVTAVRYTPEGQIDWVRAFERHGYVFSDRRMLTRQVLAERLKDGKRYFVGQRIPYQGNEFQLGQRIQLVQRSGGEVIVAGEAQGDGDHLAGTPIL